MQILNHMKNKLRHKHAKLFKITRQDAERIELEWFRRYNLQTKYEHNWII